MENIYIEKVSESREKTQCPRAEVAAKIIDFEKAKGKLSQRQFAKENSIPRSTLQHWLARKDS